MSNAVTSTAAVQSASSDILNALTSWLIGTALPVLVPFLLAVIACTYLLAWFKRQVRDGMGPSYDEWSDAYGWEPRTYDGDDLLGWTYLPDGTRVPRVSEPVPADFRTFMDPDGGWWPPDPMWMPGEPDRG